VLVDGQAIKLHPLVCNAYNADFDGDQMAVHVPLTQAAQIEAWTLMLSSRNLLNPANGQPIVFPSQDMVLGINYLTRNRDGAKGEGKHFSSPDEVILAVESRAIDYQALIKIRIDDEWVDTTAGRIILNEELPPEVGFINESMGDRELRRFIGRVYAEDGPAVTVKMLDVIKNMGFKYATVFGATIGIDDIIIPEIKREMIEGANTEVTAIQNQYQSGVITQDERYNKVVEVWSKTNEDLTNEMMKNLRGDRGGFNPVYMMADSGARGSRSQIRQLAGMRGLMAKPSGDIIELPIRSNFKEGLSVIEFFISTNGARKGLADTALKTADAGYLTRRLVAIAQDVVVTVEDCGTINGIDMTALKDGEESVETLADRIRGRFTLERVKHPITGEIIVDVNEEVSDEKADEIEAAGIEQVRIRTVLTCEAEYGVCQKCYGRNLADNAVVNIGEAVGIIAAQSIGQPGTQLTMRTFHIGGAATKTSEENRTYLKYAAMIRKIEGNTVQLDDGSVLFTRKGFLYASRVLADYEIKAKDQLLVEHDQKVVKGQAVLKRGKKETIADDNAYAIVKDKTLYLVAQEQRIEIRNGAELYVEEGQIIPAEETIASFDPFSEPIISEYSGIVRFKDIVEGTTLKKEVNEETGNTENKIVEHPVENMQPSLIIEDEDGGDVFTYPLPNSAYLNITDGETVKPGRTLAKMLKESVKTRDITGGLPRVGELFEARRPKNAAVLAQISGTVRTGGVVKGKRVVFVDDAYEREFKHLVPMGRHLLVRDGDIVEAGEQLCDGNIDPHEVLAILGENALQSFLVNEVQEVYRLQGVNINDKHIGVIIRQMMRKLEIVQVGDTTFIFGQQIDKHKFHEENARVVRQGGQPAVARPLLLGITRASLNIDSFISAASFQETTRVLTNAAIAGTTDSLRGLKENVVIGHLIPAGTGMRNYKQIRLFDDTTEDLDAHVSQILEERAREKELEAQEEEETAEVEVTE
ncbi:MAG: DNA-directed RNA polymerase subunit beta', partial [Spirochaetales bacterium]|nr:DNA-directed RNA polymerase subunit beta' [Spirochaetales bacterium]